MQHAFGDFAISQVARILGFSDDVSKVCQSQNTYSNFPVAESHCSTKGERGTLPMSGTRMSRFLMVRDLSKE